MTAAPKLRMKVLLHGCIVNYVIRRSLSWQTRCSVWIKWWISNDKCREELHLRTLCMASDCTASGVTAELELIGNANEGERLLWNHTLGMGASTPWWKEWRYSIVWQLSSRKLEGRSVTADRVSHLWCITRAWGRLHDRGIMSANHRGCNSDGSDWSLRSYSEQLRDLTVLDWNWGAWESSRREFIVKGTVNGGQHSNSEIQSECLSATINRMNGRIRN